MHLRWLREPFPKIEGDYQYVLQYSNDNGATWHIVPAYSITSDGREQKLGHVPVMVKST